MVFFGQHCLHHHVAALIIWVVVGFFLSAWCFHVGELSLHPLASATSSMFVSTAANTSIWVWPLLSSSQVTKTQNQIIVRFKAQTRCHCWLRSPEWRLLFVCAPSLCCSHWPQGCCWGGGGKKVTGGGDGGAPGWSYQGRFQRPRGRSPAAFWVGGGMRVMFRSL